MERAILLAFLVLFRLRPARPLRFALRDPALLVGLGRAREGERPGRDVLRNRRAGAHVGSVPDRDGRHELHVAPDEGLLPDPRRMLLLAIVVAGDDARSDVAP